jgi:glycine/D-amino acid oxidase-like deaminating enzyme
VGSRGHPRVVVLGGGILGVSTAVHVARRGVHVELRTENELTSGASGRSLSWLNSSGPRSAAYHQLRLLGMERYRTFAERVDAAAYLRFAGGLRWARPGEADTLRESHAHMQRIGYPSEWLSVDQVRRRVAGVDVAAVPAEGAVLNPSEGWVDLPALVAGLTRELITLGGRIAAGTGPARVVVDGGQVVAVAGADGTRTGADAVVVATGANVPRALDAVGVTVPDATPTALLVRTYAVDTPLQVVLNTPRVAMRPTPDGRLVMDSGWSERAVVTHPDGTYEVHDDTVHALLREGSAVLEGNPPLTLESYALGPKPIPGDGEPVLGRVDGVAGYHVAFTHSGATLGLIAGELIADEVVSARANPLLDPFRPSRFAAASPTSN